MNRNWNFILGLKMRLKLIPILEQILWLMRLWLKLLVDDWRLVMKWLMWMAEEENILQ